MSSTNSPFTSSELRTWLNHTIEALWLLTVLLVPLAFFGRDYAKSETIIAYVEQPRSVLWLV